MTDQLPQFTQGDWRVKTSEFCGVSDDGYPYRLIESSAPEGKAT